MVFRVLWGLWGKTFLEKVGRKHENENGETPNKINPKLKPANREKMVRIAGLEPARVAPLPPQSSVSANSTICARMVHEIRSHWSQVQLPAGLCQACAGVPPSSNAPTLNHSLCQLTSLKPTVLRAFSPTSSLPIECGFPNLAL